MTFSYKLLSIIFSVLILVLTYSKALAQTEITHREYTTEDRTHSDFSFKEKYRYFTRANVEEKTLIKVGGFLTGFWGGGGSDRKVVGFGGSFLNVVAIEQKLLPAISILAEVENTCVIWSKQGNDYAIGGKLGVRWYYFMNKHIREERRANNFSNHYLSLQSNHSLYQTEDRFKRSNMLSLLWGTQIRIGKFGYFDANIGPAIKYGTLAPGEPRIGYDANISIGFGF
ncbi:hypothetical protein Q0590_12655 [Rhodocytophaga aerolata]|uniref:DUF3575 domain-containing protein n=1 Tax=Rhodocytophaga aerolata TaxID=455078 RepID=A0ABT8R4U6_9BACT|nr:hypothetical protein [Rhodocytophaga aerolata]MDO1447111.1 hypothetical protein [Rhodocytophaga aerolata]